ncbi:MAG: VCBS repeat-containing protein [Planctomycetota bacterium]
MSDLGSLVVRSLARAALPCLGAVLVAQTPPLLRNVPGESIGDWLGFAVQGAGDVDRDGRPDLLVGAPFDDAGVVKLLSGADGSLLHEFSGVLFGDGFGIAVASAGDVDGDGWLDIVVGAYLADGSAPSAGNAYVYSGHDYSLLHTWGNGVNGSQFGWSVAGAGDVDHDGYDDVIVGAPAESLPGQSTVLPGSATVYSGATGAVLRRWFGDGHDDLFGFAVACVGDVDGDGWVDLAVGAPWDDNSFPKSGMVRVYSSNPALQQNPVLHQFDGDGLGYEFGTSICGMVDVDQDGFDDVFVGQPEDKVFGDDAGSAVLFSGHSGVRLRTWYGTTPYSYFGFCVAAGDVDGDGVPDLIVGEPRHDVTPFDDRGAVYVYSGADFAAQQNLLYSCFAGFDDGRLGQAVAFVGDGNGDGFGDFAGGLPLANSNGTQSGHCLVWGGTTANGTATTHGAGCPAATPLALGYVGQPRVGQPLTITAGNGPAAATVAWIVFGFDASAPFPIDLGVVGLTGCTQYQRAEVLVPVAMTGGAASLTLTVSPTVLPAGVVFYNQALALDAASPIGLRISDAGRVVMGQ